METSDVEPELPRGIALAWGVAATPQRGPRRELSIEGIVATAMDIADAEGLAAVSMTAVAAKLGYTTMSLYRYVSAKDDMVLLMYEQALGVPPRPEGNAGWREAAETIFNALLAVYRARPWVLDIPIQGIPSTPNSVAWMDAGLIAYDSTPLSQADRLSATLLLSGQAYWQSIIERMYNQAAPDETSLEAVERSWEQMLLSLVTAEQFPAVSRVLDEGLLGPESAVDPFGAGLELMLDGIAGLIEESERKQPSGAPWHAETRGPDGSEAASVAFRSVEIEAAVMKDSAVREASRKRREAETRVRQAETKLREAQRKEQDALTKGRERARKHAEKQGKSTGKAENPPGD